MPGDRNSFESPSKRVSDVSDPWKIGRWFSPGFDPLLPATSGEQSPWSWSWSDAGYRIHTIKLLHVNVNSICNSDLFTAGRWISSENQFTTVCYKLIHSPPCIYPLAFKWSSILVIYTYLESRFLGFFKKKKIYSNFLGYDVVNIWSRVIQKQIYEMFNNVCSI